MRIVIQTLVLALVFLGIQTDYLSPAEIESKYEMIEVTVTAYSPDKAQTVGDVFRTASNLRVTPLDLWQMKYVAVSRDLKERYKLRQTVGDVFRTASNLKVTPLDLWQMKYVAVSRDLKERYRLRWGDVIFIGFEVQDLMSEYAGGKKIVNTIDLFLRSRKIAKNFGRQKRKIIIVRKNEAR